jgi:outer membrane protein TolC
MMCAFIFLHSLPGQVFAEAFVEDTPAAGLDLKTLVHLAVTHDPWLSRSRALESALLFESSVAARLPDPQMSASLMNFPTDSFNFSQEPMTQVQLGITQRIPRGNSRKFKSRIKALESETHHLRQAARSQQVELRVTTLWLDLYLTQNTSDLIVKDKPLFQQLIEVTNASYSNALGQTSQQDLIRVQLELTRLDDRLLKLKHVQTSRKQEFAEWLPAAYLAAPITWSMPDNITRKPPEPTNGESLHQLLAKHPELRVIDQTIQSRRVGLLLARESTKPDWSVNASYAHRDKDRFGNELADLVSVGVSFDLPFFKRRKHQNHINATANMITADESQRLIGLQHLQQRYLKAHAELKVTDERLALYQDSLVNQLDILAQASLNAYTSGRGSFSDVMRAYIALLNARIEVQTIEVNRLKILAEIRYLIAGGEVTA